MDPERLVQMANQIGQFHQTLPDHTEAVLGTATHLRRFWDPRMRRTLFSYLDATGGEGLSPMVLEALQVHRATIEPGGA